MNEKVDLLILIKKLEIDLNPEKEILYKIETSVDQISRKNMKVKNIHNITERVKFKL